jgi:hypothetical protein
VIPDEALLDAAESGELDGDGLMAYATNMFEDPRTETTLTRFNEEWLGVSTLHTIQRDPDAGCVLSGERRM